MVLSSPFSISTDGSQFSNNFALLISGLRFWGSSEGNESFGFNAKDGTYVDMLKEGIIDPKKVTRVALENAASVAGMILTTECALIDIKEEAPPAPPMGGGGMPGMM